MHFLGLGLILCSDTAQLEACSKGTSPGAAGVGLQGRRLWEGRSDRWRLRWEPHSLICALPTVLGPSGGFGARRTKDAHEFSLLQERGSDGKRLRSKSVPSACEIASPPIPCGFNTALSVMEGWCRQHVRL